MRQRVPVHHSGKDNAADRRQAAVRSQGGEKIRQKGGAEGEGEGEEKEGEVEELGQVEDRLMAQKNKNQRIGNNFSCANAYTFRENLQKCR